MGTNAIKIPANQNEITLYCFMGEAFTPLLAFK
jgi:hypothetical protein